MLNITDFVELKSGSGKCKCKMYTKEAMDVAIACGALKAEDFRRCSYFPTGNIDFTFPVITAQGVRRAYPCGQSHCTFDREQMLAFREEQKAIRAEQKRRTTVLKKLQAMSTEELEKLLEKA